MPNIPHDADDLAADDPPSGTIEVGAG